MLHFSRSFRPALFAAPALLLAALTQLGGAQPTAPLALSSLTAQTLTVQGLNSSLGASAFTGLAPDAARERIGTFEKDLGQLGFRRGWAAHHSGTDFTSYYRGEPDLTVIRSVEGSEQVSMTAYALPGKIARNAAFPIP